VLLSPEHRLPRCQDGQVSGRGPCRARSESSPIVIKGVRYFGLPRRTRLRDAGRPRQDPLDQKKKKKKNTMGAAGAVKGGLASPTASGNLYFGDYTCEFYSNPSLTEAGLTASTSSLAFRPARATSRHSVRSRTGACSWQHRRPHVLVRGFERTISPGASRPATRVPARPSEGPPGLTHGLRLLLRRNFYSADAPSGNPWWEVHAGGRISGAPTSRHIVYFSILANKTPIGRNVKNATPVFARCTVPSIRDLGRQAPLSHGYSSEFAFVSEAAQPAAGERAGAESTIPREAQSK